MLEAVFVLIEPNNTHQEGTDQATEYLIILHATSCYLEGTPKGKNKVNAQEKIQAERNQLKEIVHELVRPNQNQQWLVVRKVMVENPIKYM